jgi:hypothetical protein
VPHYNKRLLQKRKKKFVPNHKNKYSAKKKNNVLIALEGKADTKKKIAKKNASKKGCGKT